MKKYLILYNNTNKNFNDFICEFDLIQRKKFNLSDNYICIVKSIDKNGKEIYFKGFTFNQIEDVLEDLIKSYAYDYTGIDLIMRIDGKLMNFQDYCIFIKNKKCN